MLLEAGEIAHGSTAATTALIQYEIDTHLVDLIDRVGRDHAVRSYRLCLDAVRGIGDLARTGDDDCAWRATRSLYLASRRRDRAVLEREYAARRSAGIEVELLDERDIRDRFSFTGPAALLSPVAGELDAFRLTHKLLAEARSRRPRGVRPHPGDGYDAKQRRRRAPHRRRRPRPRPPGRVRHRLRDAGVPRPQDRAPAQHVRPRYRAGGALRRLGRGPVPHLGDRAAVLLRPHDRRRPRRDGRRRPAVRDRAQPPPAPRPPDRPARGPLRQALPRPFLATWTGAGAAPSARPGTACPTSAACGNFPTAISPSATEGTGSRSAGSRRICCSIGSWSGRIRMRSCLGLRDSAAAA